MNSSVTVYDSLGGNKTIDENMRGQHQAGGHEMYIVEGREQRHIDRHG